jgi:hypothetical protein
VASRIMLGDYVIKHLSAHLSAQLRNYKLINQIFNKVIDIDVITFIWLIVLSQFIFIVAREFMCVYVQNFNVQFLRSLLYLSRSDEIWEFPHPRISKAAFRILLILILFSLLRDDVGILLFYAHFFNANEVGLCSS